MTGPPADGTPELPRHGLRMYVRQPRRRLGADPPRPTACPDFPGTRPCRANIRHFHPTTLIGIPAPTATSRQDGKRRPSACAVVVVVVVVIIGGTHAMDGIATVQ